MMERERAGESARARARERKIKRVWYQPDAFCPRYRWYTHICVYICVYMHTCVDECMCVRAYTSMYVCVCV
jgi:hypothetical protein